MAHDSRVGNANENSCIALSNHSCSLTMFNIKPGDKEKIDDPCSAHQIKIVTPQKPPTLEKAGIPHKTA